jgi:uncharacterized protein Yka (UPF0111/DUF47 family)
MLESIKTFFNPQQDLFFDLLIQQAEYAVEATGMVLTYLEEPNKQRKKETRQVEKQADKVRRQLVKALSDTFVTPIDREDLYALSRDLDDVVDYAYTTTDELVLFQLETNDFMMKIAALIHNGADELLLAMHCLKDNPNDANNHAMQAKKMETRVEKAYRRALAELFTAPEDLAGMVEILKRREVYRHLSNTADRIDEAADILSDIVVKMS